MDEIFSTIHQQYLISYLNSLSIILLLYPLPRYLLTPLNDQNISVYSVYHETFSHDHDYKTVVIHKSSHKLIYQMTTNLLRMFVLCFLSPLDSHNLVYQLMNKFLTYHSIFCIIHNLIPLYNHLHQIEYFRVLDLYIHTHNHADNSMQDIPELHKI
jgi:hypothetical protein